MRLLLKYSVQTKKEFNEPSRAAMALGFNFGAATLSVISPVLLNKNLNRCLPKKTKYSFKLTKAIQ